MTNVFFENATQPANQNWYQGNQVSFTYSYTYIEVESIEIQQENFIGIEGNEYQLNAEVYPINASNPGVIWSSSSNQVYIQQDGRFNTEFKGTFDVFATSAENSAIVDTITITIEPYWTLDTYSIIGTLGEWDQSIEFQIPKVGLGEYKLNLYLESNFEFYVYKQADNGDNNSYYFNDLTNNLINEPITNNSHLIKVLESGRYEIHIQYAAASAPQSISFRYIAPYVPVQSITITSPNNLSEVIVDETIQLSAAILPENATDKDLIWTSSNIQIASVDQDGLVTGVGFGTVTIKATLEADQSMFKEFQLTSYYSSESVESIDIILQQTRMTINQQSYLEIRFEPSGFTTDDVIFTSSNEDILTVASDGLVTAHEYGSATITAVSTFNEMISDTVTLDVIESSQVNVNLSPFSSNDEFGKSYRVQEAYVLHNRAYEQLLLGQSQTITASEIILGSPEGVFPISMYNPSTMDADLLKRLQTLKPGSYVSISGTITSSIGGGFARGHYLQVSPTSLEANLVIHQDNSWVFGGINVPNSTIDLKNGFKAWIDDKNRNNIRDLGKFYILNNVRFVTLTSSGPYLNNHDFFNYSELDSLSNSIGSSTNYVRIGMFQGAPLSKFNVNTTDSYDLIAFVGGSNQYFTNGFGGNNPILRVNYIYSIANTGA